MEPVGWRQPDVLGGACSEATDPVSCAGSSDDSSGKLTLVFPVTNVSVGSHNGSVFTITTLPCLPA